MDRNLVRQITVVLATLMVVLFNGVATVLPINNLRTAEIANRFEFFFIPAGYVFSIWGLIYLGLLAYSVYQALPAQRVDERLQRVGFLYIWSCFANVAWLILWHYERFTLALVAMLALLGLLNIIYLRLDICKTQVSKIEKLVVHIPFSIYLGWITIASISEIAWFMKYWGWNGWGISSELWALLLLAIASMIAGTMIYTRRDIAFTLVFIWAFIGIAIQNREASLIATGAWVAALVTGISIFIEGTLKHDPC